MGLASVTEAVRSFLDRDYRYQRLSEPSSTSGTYGRREHLARLGRQPQGLLPQMEASGKQLHDDETVSGVWARGNRLLLKLSIMLVSAILIMYLGFAFSRAANVRKGASCDTVDHGYQCYASVAQHWGQYAPFFSVPSSEDSAAGSAVPGEAGLDANANAAEVPPHCRFTFAQVLSRHGARDPTAGRSLAYGALIARIQGSVEHFADGQDGKFAFLADYTYRLGADELTAFGERQMVHSGEHFFSRYRSLAQSLLLSGASGSPGSSVVMPFVRTAGQHRVVVSAINWIHGFHKARMQDPGFATTEQLSATSTATATATAEQPLVVIPEESGFNNTLSYNGLCKAFTGRAGVQAQSTYAATFVPDITARLNRGLPGAEITDGDTIALMDMCPFETIADEDNADGEGDDDSDGEGDKDGKTSAGGRRLSPFCDLFPEAKWRQYDYYQTLGKWYGYGDGSALGATQGVGYVNELVARLTKTPVVDHTSTNRTLDADPATFPLNATLYADFSHDNDMANIFAALGLYNGSRNGREREGPLRPSNTSRTEPADMRGYAASWVVPFAARMYVEKMACDGDSEELVRVLVNDRVVPLAGCGADELGRCTLSRFVDSLAFARSGGRWDDCFA